MKKFLFSLTMLAAVALAGLTTSCGGNDNDNTTTNGGGNVVPQPDVEKVYTSTVDINAVNPENPEEKAPLGQVESNVDVKIKPSTSTLDLKIVGIDLSSIGVPAVAEPFDVQLANIPYTLVDGVYNINFTEKVNLPFASVSAEMQYLKGSIQNNTIEMEIYAIGSEDLMDMPVLISVNGTEKN